MTSKETFSAAESFTYTLKDLRRTTIIGEITGGGANCGNHRQINGHLLYIYPSRPIDPITQTNWKGVGVILAIEVPAELALKTAHLAAMNNLH